MKICCSTYWYPESRDDIHATYVHDINRYLVKLGHEVCVVTPSFSGEAGEDEFDGVKVHRFRFRASPGLTYGKVAQGRSGDKGLSRLIDKVRQKGSIIHYILLNFAYTFSVSRRVKVDIIHAHWAIPSGFPALIAAKLLGKPCIITMHGGDVYHNPEQGYVFPGLWYVRPLLRYTLRHADRLTAISRDCRMHAVRAGASDSSIDLIYNGADLERFSPANDGNVESIRRRYNLDEYTIFSCRQLIPRKGMRFLINAMPEVLSVYPTSKLLIAGDGVERFDLETLVRELHLESSVIFLGWIPNKELPSYYNVAQVCVLPSLEEGFGIPAAEAMACQKPVIVTDAGGLPEIVASGDTGLVVPRGNSEALANGIIRILGDPGLARKMGESGRKKAEALYSWEKTALEISKLYETVLCEQ